MRIADMTGSTYPNLPGCALGTEFRADGGRAEVRGHGEVRDRGGEEDHDGDLVEQTFASWPLH